jgi:hypothetical protein
VRNLNYLLELYIRNMDSTCGGMTNSNAVE